MRFLVLVLFAAASSCATEEWELFKTHHHKHYPSAEHENYRRSIFLGNLKRIRKHNLEADLKLHSWYMGINQFSDMTGDEVINTMTGYRQAHVSRGKNLKLKNLKVQVPNAIDWVQKGYVNTPVSQGQCGSCYTFSATAALEGQYKKINGTLVKFAEQNLVDCTKCDANRRYSCNNGCNGGRSDKCFNYVKSWGGLMLDADYSYTAKVGTCSMDKNKIIHFRVKDTKYLHTEDELKKAVGSIGPVCVAICANEKWMAYSHGVFNVPDCPTDLNHAVTVVGYGSENNEDYWLVKNSWGDYWGEKGYIRMIRNNQNQCGIYNDMFYPELALSS